MRVAFPLFDGAADVRHDLKASDLTFELCPKEHAVALCRAWHSRLPNTQAGPWEFAFHAQHDGVTYAVALWNNPSARTLPGHWLELRRMACSSEAPPHTPSAFLAAMTRFFNLDHRHREKLISYQDTAVHAGTIYRAAGWTDAYTSAPRIRDRSKARTGTSRLYRSNLNGEAPDASAKVRWEKDLKPPRRDPLGAPMPKSRNAG